MHDFPQLRFDDRIFKGADPGSAFAQFVDEFLKLQNHNETFVRGLAKGRDGAIDLIDTGQIVTHIVECKFIGATAKDSALKRWQEVAGHLEKNLPKAALSQGAAKYRPWLKSQSNIQTYSFVTSAICADANERNQLRQSIKAFFDHISNQHDELSHLRDLKIDLRYWDDLVGHHANYAPLFYRWFGGFPAGYGDISLSFGTSETSFKRFLEDTTLPYFAHDNYQMQTGRAGKSRIKDALTHLTTNNAGCALVISGPGGVGKTRMAIEICELARDRGWWPVRLERYAKASDLDELCQSHSVSANILLFIDYAEAFEDLDKLPEAIRRIAQDGKHRISILASTRSSSIQRVTDSLIDIEPLEVNVGDDPEAEEYNSWVVKQILAHFELPDLEAVAASCSGLPVIAAFAAFLYRRDPAKFDEQFGSLVAGTDFSAWVRTRLKSVEAKFQGQQVQRPLAELALQLPMTHDEAERFRKSSPVNGELFEILKADHWIEMDGQTCSSAHDVLADAMLARHLSGVPESEQTKLQDLLGEALTGGWLDRGLTVVDRLGQHPVFEKLSGKKTVDALMIQDSAKTLAQLPVIVQKRLLTSLDLIDLLADSEEMRVRLGQAPDAHLAVARAAEWAATKGRDKIDRLKAEQALNQPL